LHVYPFSCKSLPFIVIGGETIYKKAGESSIAGRIRWMEIVSAPALTIPLQTTNTSKYLCSTYNDLNGGYPGGAFIIKSTKGMTYPIDITAIIKTTHKLQRSVHFGVGEASSSSSAIGNSVSPFGARSIKWKTIYTTINTEISRIVAPIPTKIRYGSQLAATSLEK